MSGTEHSGKLEKFAVQCALRAAWTTELWIPSDPDYHFVDYLEAAATRNLGLLRGFEELADTADRRGILPPAEGDQAYLVTDGGRVKDGSERELWPVGEYHSCFECGVKVHQDDAEYDERSAGSYFVCCPDCAVDTGGER